MNYSSRAAKIKNPIKIKRNWLLSQPFQFVNIT